MTGALEAPKINPTGCRCHLRNVNKMSRLSDPRLGSLQVALGTPCQKRETLIPYTPGLFWSVMFYVGPSPSILIECLVFQDLHGVRAIFQWSYGQDSDCIGADISDKHLFVGMTLGVHR